MQKANRLSSQRHRFPPGHMSKAVPVSQPASKPTAAPDASQVLDFKVQTSVFLEDFFMETGWLQLLWSKHTRSGLRTPWETSRPDFRRLNPDRKVSRALGS